MTAQPPAPPATMFDAICAGNVDLVLRHLGEGSPPPLDGGLTCAMLAAQLGHIGLLRGFIARGDPLEARNDTGFTALMLAAESGQARAVAVLLELGADRAAANEDGLDALTLARANEHEEIVALLTAAPGPVVSPVVAVTVLRKAAARTGDAALLEEARVLTLMLDVDAQWALMSFRGAFTLAEAEVLARRVTARLGVAQRFSDAARATAEHAERLPEDTRVLWLRRAVDLSRKDPARPGVVETELAQRALKRGDPLMALSLLDELRAIGRELDPGLRVRALVHLGDPDGARAAAATIDPAVHGVAYAERNRADAQAAVTAATTRAAPTAAEDTPWRARLEREAERGGRRIFSRGGPVRVGVPEGSSPEAIAEAADKLGALGPGPANEVAAFLCDSLANLPGWSLVTAWSDTMRPSATLREDDTGRVWSPTDVLNRKRKGAGGSLLDELRALATADLPIAAWSTPLPPAPESGWPYDAVDADRRARLGAAGDIVALRTFFEGNDELGAFRNSADAPARPQLVWRWFRAIEALPAVSSMAVVLGGPTARWMCTTQIVVATDAPIREIWSWLPPELTPAELREAPEHAEKMTVAPGHRPVVMRWG